MKPEYVARSRVTFLVFQSNSEIIYMYMKYISSTAAAFHEGERKKNVIKVRVSGGVLSAKHFLGQALTKSGLVPP